MRDRHYFYSMAVVDTRINSVKRSDKITNENKEIIFKFVDHCITEGLSPARLLFYLNTLPRIAQWAGKPFAELTKDDIQSIIVKVEKMGYSVWHTQAFKITFKKFYKWLDGSDEYPARVKWIKTTVKNHKLKLPDDILTQGDIRKMLEACTSMRDKAIIATLFEGLRIGEMLGLSIKSISFDSLGAVATVNGKTGSRRVRLTIAVPYLAQWIENHPNKNDKKSALFVCVGSKNHCEPIGYNTIRYMLQETAEKAKIQKRVNPHSFRAARATDLCAKGVPEPVLCQQFGWVPGTDVIGTYIRLSGKQVDNIILQANGIQKSVDKEESQLKSIICYRCKYINPPEAKMCCQCGAVLNLEEAQRLDRKLDEFARLVDDPEIIEKLIEKKVREILEEKRSK